MTGTGWVIFWLVATGLLFVLLAAWYFYARPRRRFGRTGNPDHLKGSVGRLKTVIEWNTGHTRRECPACGGWGDLRLHKGRLVKIPRSRWEYTRWVTRHLTMTCPSCQGLGNVAANFRLPPGA